MLKILQVMHELETKTELNERLKDEVAVLHRKVGVCRHQVRIHSAFKFFLM